MSTEYTDSSGNVFADLGFPDADARLIKARLIVTLERAMRSRSVSPAQIAAALGCDPATFDAAFDGHFDAISTDDLLRALTALDRDVQIVIGPKADDRTHGQVTVIDQPAA